MQPNKEEIAAELKKILVEDLFIEIPPEKIKETDSLNTDLGLDSVGYIELISLLEERYGLRLDAAAAAQDMKTVGSATDYIFKNVQAAHAGAAASQTA